MEHLNIDELKREIETLLTKIFTLSLGTYEQFMNLIIEFLKKVSPVPLMIPHIIIPDYLKTRSCEELAKTFSSMIVAPLKPDSLIKLIEEILGKAKKLEELLKMYSK